MLDFVKHETERIDSRFFEPACGDGNFLAEVLRRKLAVVKKRYKKSPYDYEMNSVVAMTGIYGVDIMLDNVEACRDRLFEIWDSEYTSICKLDANDECRTAVRFILERNILCGNALTLKNDDEKPIIFSEWSLICDSMMLRKDFLLHKLLEDNEKPKDIFSPITNIDIPVGQSGTLFAYDDGDNEGEFLCQYITHYKKVHVHGE